MEVAMFPLVEFPELVQHYAPEFEKVFSPEAFLEFQRYSSGLIVSENKTVDGINRLFVHESRNQSSLNRLLTASPFSLPDLNQARLRVLDQLPGTQMKRKGVLSVDDTFLIHTGEHFDQIALLKDPETGHYVRAHDLVTLHYSDDDTDYPVRFQLWKPTDVDALEKGLVAAGLTLQESKHALKTTAPHKWRNYLQGIWRRHQDRPEVAALYQSKLLMAEQLLQDWVQSHPSHRLPVTFDNWYTQPAFCRSLTETLQLDYVGSLAENDVVLLRRGDQRLDHFAEQLKQEHLAAIQRGKPPLFQPITVSYKGEQERYYSYCATHRLQTFGRQRLVINYRQADLSDDPVFFISNNLAWQAAGITRIRRHRWPVEVYHEEGKAEGLDHASRRSGTFKPLNDTLAWSPWSTACCVQLNRIPPSNKHFTVNSSSSLRGAMRSGVGRPRPRACGAWRS
jgi:DDE superfamily endonuclease